MVIYPSIDLINGRATRLAQGDYARATHYETDPLALARDYVDAGARWLHLVDLDAARSGQPTQLALITKLAAFEGLALQVGGGVRDEPTLAALLEAGASRVAIGSMAVRCPELAIEWLHRYGPERICLALDVRAAADGPFYPAASAWTESGSETLEVLLDRYLAEAKPRHVLCTDIARDGMLAGPNVELYRRLASRYPTLQFQASGGVRDGRDARALRAAGVAGIVVGKALLDGRVSLQELLSC
jgi:phosphoribosylformimino-5-aminoimidazole carboxamide ribotide isomerase